MEKWPRRGSACQGGIRPSLTASAIEVDQRRAWSKVSRENGATWPGRWQIAQRLCRMAATSAEYVTVDPLDAVAGDPSGALVTFGADDRRAEHRAGLSRRPGALDRAAEDLGHFRAHRLAVDYRLDRLGEIIPEPAQSRRDPRAYWSSMAPRYLRPRAAVDHERFAGALGEQLVGNAIFRILKTGNPIAAFLACSATSSADSLALELIASMSTPRFSNFLARAFKRGR